MNLADIKWSFAVEAVVVLFFFASPMSDWIGYVPTPAATDPTTDERRLAFQALSEALKAGITMLSIGFGLNGLLVALREHARLASSDLIFAIGYGLIAAFFGVWGLLALPQYVHRQLATQLFFFGLVTAAHFTFLFLAFWRLSRYLISVIRDRAAAAVQLPEVTQALEAKIQEIENLKKLLARVEIRNP